MISVEERIIQIINASLKEKNEKFTLLSLDQSDQELSQHGMDSITFIRIIVKLEELFTIQIPDEKLLITEMGTVGKIIKVILSILKATE